jgi:tight adherence protein C
LSIEASLERVGREIGESYPSLCANIHMTNFEIRAGRSMTAALEHLGDRLGLEEARAFSALIQQSTELGSSITDALRVYSDDMRHKRLSRAEEKAYSLPAKLSVPMMVCIFPVLFVVILLPIIVPIRAIIEKKRYPGRSISSHFAAARLSRYSIMASLFAPGEEFLTILF